MNPGTYFVDSKTDMVIGITNIFPFIHFEMKGFNLTWLLVLWCIMTVILEVLMLLAIVHYLAYQQAFK